MKFLGPRLPTIVLFARYDVFCRAVVDIPMRLKNGSQEFQLKLHNPKIFKDPPNTKPYWQPLSIILNLPYVKVSFSPDKESDKVAATLMFDTGTPFCCCGAYCKPGICSYLADLDVKGLGVHSDYFQPYSALNKHTLPFQNLCISLIGLTPGSVKDLGVRMSLFPIIQ